MEAIGFKFIIAILHIIGLPIYFTYCLIYKGMTIGEILADEQVQNSLDILSITFYTYFVYLKVFCGGINIHSVFENIVFYVVGFVTIFYATFRALSQYEDYRTKKHIRKYNKEMLDEASKK